MEHIHFLKILLFSHAVVFDSLQPMDCGTPNFPSLSSRVYANSCPVSRWCYPTISSSVASSFSFPQSFFFSTESALCIRWPKYWSFSFNPSIEYSELIFFFFRNDYFDLLAVQGTLKSLLQYHSLKASILWHSAFFMVQLSHLYMATGKTIALTRWTFARKVISLFFNTLSRLVIAFLQRRKHLLISRLLSSPTKIVEPKKSKICHCFHCFPIYLPWSDGTVCHDLSFLNVEFKASFFTLLFHIHKEAF